MQFNINYPKADSSGWISTHPDDMELFERLGLMTFDGLPNGQAIYLGFVAQQHNLSITYVSAYAIYGFTFFRFNINWFQSKDGKLVNKVKFAEIRSDTGLLRTYWPTVEGLVQDDVHEQIISIPCNDPIFLKDSKLYIEKVY